MKKYLSLVLILLLSFVFVSCGNQIDVKSIIDNTIETAFENKADYKSVYMEKFNYTINNVEKIDNETYKVNIDITQKDLKEIGGLAIKKQMKNIMDSTYTSDMSMIEAFKEVETINTKNYDIEIKLVNNEWVLTDTNFLFDLK